MLKVLTIDFDDVIIDTKPNIAKMLAKLAETVPVKKVYDPFSGKMVSPFVIGNDTYLKNVGKWYESKCLSQRDDDEIKDDLDRYNRCTHIHFDYKDRILEEFDPEFKEVIDYSKVFTLDNVFKGQNGQVNAVDWVNYISSLGEYDEIIILSHCNVQREIDAKREFIEKYLDKKIKFIPVIFHEVEYDGSKRDRSSKYPKLMQYLTKKYGEEEAKKADILHLDDSRSVNSDMRKYGVRTINIDYFMKNSEYGNALANNETGNVELRRSTNTLDPYMLQLIRTMNEKDEETSKKR